METKEENKWCVYIHRNKINNKSYIGITQQKPERRWQNGYGYKNNQYFWRSIKKYGWNNFDHMIWADNLTESEASHMEALLISLFDTTNPDLGYNISHGGDFTHCGISHSEETKEKLSVCAKERFKNPENHPRKGRKHTEEAKMKMSAARKNISYKTKQKLNQLRPISYNSDDNGDNIIFVCQYDMSGKLLNEFFGISFASNQTGISRTAISNCLCGVSKTAGGYIWKYNYEKPTEKDIINANINKKLKKSDSEVCYHKWYDDKRKKWRTRFVCNNKTHSLGQYFTEVEADAAIEEHKKIQQQYKGE